MPYNDFITDGFSDELADECTHFSADINADTITADLRSANGYDWL
jgi:hypothetical protein